jgi:hypothetical protein
LKISKTPYVFFQIEFRKIPKNSWKFLQVPLKFKILKTPKTTTVHSKFLIFPKIPKISWKSLKTLENSWKLLKITKFQLLLYFYDQIVVPSDLANWRAWEMFFEPVFCMDSEPQDNILDFYLINYHKSGVLESQKFFSTWFKMSFP